MPFSFTEIEREKSKVIFLGYVVLSFFYFISFALILFVSRLLFYQWISFTSTTQGPYVVGINFRYFSLIEIAVILLLAIFIAFLHFDFSTRDLINNILKVLKAKECDQGSFSHKQFLNIISEISIATANVQFEGRVINSSCVNTFAIEDFNDRKIIGVTQGLLSKCNRAQIETVVAHQAALILRGDALDSTVIASLFNLPIGILYDFNSDIDSLSAVVFRSIKGTFTIFALWVCLFLYKVIGQFINIILLPDRQLRADAIAVRLTRDPLSLAEALYIASFNWRGAGLPAQYLSALFFVRLKFSAFKETDSFWSNLFSTHPAINKRISILLDMAHVDYDVLAPLLVHKQYDALLKIIESQKDQEHKWNILCSGQWQGPFSLEELKANNLLRPEMVVKKLGEQNIKSLKDDLELQKILKNESKVAYCPKCYLVLQVQYRNDYAVWGCHQCHGLLVEKKDLDKLKNMNLDSAKTEVIEFANSLNKFKIQYQNQHQKELLASYQLICPKCQDFGHKMNRSFFNKDVQIEIDVCPNCQVTWFDRFELEALQYSFSRQK